MVSKIESSKNRVRVKLTKWGATAINTPVDFETGTAVISFLYKGNNYTFRFKSKNGRDALAKLSWSLCRLIDCDIRKILPFSSTAKEYLALTGNSIPLDEAKPTEVEYLSPETFAELDLTYQASNEELQKSFKKLAQMFHPDRAMNEEDKVFYSNKMAKLNEAWTKIKKARGIQ